MATTYKAVFNYLDADGKTITHNYNYAKSEPEEADVKAVMAATIANGEIFKRVPVSKKSAYILQQTQTDYAVE